MDPLTDKFSYCGKLSTRSISAEEEIFTWDISSCLLECGGKQQRLKSPEFCFGATTWYLFAKLEKSTISFGIDVLKRSSSDEVFNCSCNVFFQNLKGDVCKSFELNYKRGKDMPFVSMLDLFPMNNTLETPPEKIPGGALIVCEIRANKVTDITYSNDCSATKAIYKNSLNKCPTPFSKKVLTHGGKLYSKLISTEQKELTWDISIRLPHYRNVQNYSIERVELKSPEFHFGNATWNLLASVTPYKTFFGINVQEQSSSDEVLDCCCNISCQNRKGDIFKNFDFQFKYDKTVPYVIMTDYFEPKCSSYRRNLSDYGGLIIVCRIRSKKSSIMEPCSQTKMNYSRCSAVSDYPPTHRLESQDGEIPPANLNYNVCQDLKKILDSGEGSDVTIQIGDQSFKAHMSILTARSSVFAAMLRHHMKEKATGVVVVKDCDASSFPVFLEFLYCGSTEKLSADNVFSLYNTAVKYDRQDLKMICLQFTKSNLCVANFCETVHLSLLHSETGLLNLSKDFFARNMKEIIKTAKWHAFIVENPIQGNEILIKALESG